MPDDNDFNTDALATVGRTVLPKLGVHVDGETDAYVAERFRQTPCWRWDGESFAILDQLASESMAAGISQAELEEICHKQKTTWSNGNPVTEQQRLAACAATNA